MPLLPRAVGASPLPAMLMLSMLPQLIQKFADTDKADDARSAARNPAYLNNIVEEYDYVIVGAGSAGAVVANRLSKDEKISVLVLQDGGNPSPYIDVPAFRDETLFQPSTDYAYKIVKQKNACLAEDSYNKRCYYHRGIGLGGTSNIYTMTVLQGNARDYDRWAEITLDNSWGSANVTDVFKKLEDYNGHFIPPDLKYHGVGGESHVAARQTFSRIPSYVYDACAELALPLEIDANANHTVGCGHLDVNINRGVRWGSYNAFLKPILKRSNLKIYRYAKVTKINFDGEMRATGVTYVRHGVTHTVNAKHEVIICAGVIDSPKLLLLSGIGPTEALNASGVTPLLNLPVGVTLHDHVGADIEFTINRSHTAFIPQRDMSAKVIAEYVLNAQGPLASPVYSPRAVVFFTSKEFNNPLWPDIELIISGQNSNTPLPNGVYVDKILVRVILMRSFSVGTVTLASNNPADPPIINPNLLHHVSDLRRLMEGLDFGLKLIGSTETFKRLGATFVEVPACNKTLTHDQFLECLARYSTSTQCHATGTVKMGDKGDPTAVLDSRLRVRGTLGLRVVDSSSMPTIPAGHTHTPTIMLAEIGAGFILEDRE